MTTITAHVYLIRHAFNEPGGEFANLGLVLVSDDVQRIDMSVTNAPHTKSRADYAIEPRTAMAFFDRVNRAIQAIGIQRKKQQEDSALANGLVVENFTDMFAAAVKDMRDGPYIVARTNNCGVNVEEGSPTEETTMKAYGSMVSQAIHLLLVPKHHKAKGGILLPSPVDLAKLIRKRQRAHDGKAEAK